MQFKNTVQRSWWEKESMCYQRDLIIVGSGITGLSTALFWKRAHPGSRVLVLDRGFWPTGATGRNAGFACFGSAGELVDDLVNESEDAVKDRLRLRLEGLDLLRTELGDHEIGYAMTGGYEIFDSVSDPHYQESIDQMPRFSTWVEEITGVPNSYESRTVNGYPSIFNHLEGYLNSGMMLQQVLRKVTEAGVEVRWNTPVAQVHAGGVVLSDGLELGADRILLATNGYTSTLSDSTQVQPARGYIFVTKPLKTMPWSGSCHYNRGYVYFRDLGDRLLIGGARDVDKSTETSIENEINPRIRQWLIDFVSTRLHIDENWEIDTEWTGVMGFGASKTPECYKSVNGVYIAAGLGGMGVAIGMKLAQKTTLLLQD
jgi:glycine/D-amino acid oxidase-like deaminating enzyme